MVYMKKLGFHHTGAFYHLIVSNRLHKLCPRLRQRDVQLWTLLSSSIPAQ